MKTIICAFIMAALFTACDSKKSDAASGAGAEAKTEDAQATPAGAANMIFTAASSGDYSKLKNLCDPAVEADKDSKMICEVPDGDEELKTMFKKEFSKGKVVGEPTIEGDDAKVNIMFGPEGTNEETLNMKRKDGKWYLVSF